MRPLLQTTVLLALLVATFFPMPARAKETITIVCDSGRTGFIDNSLVATAVAVEKGADYLELPLQLSADDQLMVYHSPVLGENTNIADLFPMRSPREDGSYYLVDFTLLELQQIRQMQATSVNKPPLQLPIASLPETLGLLSRFNENRLEPTGIVLHILQPSFYTKQGKDIGGTTVQMLLDSGYTADDKLFLESSDPDELQKIARFSDNLGRERFSLIQRVELEQKNAEKGATPAMAQQDNGWLFTNSGLRILASYTAALALPTEILEGKAFTAMDIGTFLRGLRQYNIKIFAITKNGESIQLPPLQPVESETEQVSETLPEETRNSVDGRFVNSFRKLVEEVEQDTDPIVTTLEKVEPSSSALPPFFSNLGLKQPNNARAESDNKQSEGLTSEESETIFEDSPTSWE